MVIVRKFIAAAKAKVVATLDRQLEQALKTDNVGQFVRLVAMNAGAGIDKKINDMLLHKIEQGNVQFYIRVFTALAGSSYELIIRPSLVCHTIHKLDTLRIRPESKMGMLLELGAVTQHCNDSRYAKTFHKTYRGITGRSMPSGKRAPLALKN